MNNDFKFFHGSPKIVLDKKFKEHIRRLLIDQDHNRNVPGNWIIVNQATADMLNDSTFYENLYNL